MKLSQEGEGYGQAKEAARVLISSLREEDQAALIPTNTLDGQQIRIKEDQKALLRRLDGIPVSAGTADFSFALRKAYELLKEPSGQKAIWLITDMAQTGWDLLALSSMQEYDPQIPLKIIKVGKNGGLPNATIKEIKMQEQGVAVGLPIHLDAVIANFSNEEIKDVLVQLHLNDKKKEQRLVSLSPKEELTVGFDFSPEKPGSTTGYVELKKAGVVGNPIVYFTILAREKLKILIVDGDPQTSLVQSESFFLTRALNPGGGKDSSFFLPTVIIPESLNSVSLKSYQAIIFCNVPVIPDAILPRLREYLLRGGGLFLFLGDRVRVDDYNRKLFNAPPPILPDRLGEKRVIFGSKGEEIGTVNVTHPSLKSLAGKVLETSLKSAKVNGYFRTRISGASSLLTLANGDPLLVEKKVGPGRVLLFTTSADLEWSDLPFKTVYLPLMQSLVSYLSGNNRGSADTGTTAGAARSFSFPSSFTGKSIRIIKPDDTKRETKFLADGEKASAAFQENDLAGIYRLSLPGRSQDNLPVPAIYAVNPPFLESRLTKISADELQSKLDPIDFEIIPPDSLEQGGTRMDLSLPLLILLIAILALEGWLSQRIYE
jgi:hypothetical protein